MSMMDRNGTIWYSEDYLKEMMRRSERKGFSEGIKIEFHAITPALLKNRTVDDVKKELREFLALNQ